LRIPPLPETIFAGAAAFCGSRRCLKPSLRLRQAIK